MSKSLRDEMPQTAAFIDSMRNLFGAESINQQIRAGLNGEPTFYAKEGGHELGTKWIEGGNNAKSKVDR